MERLRQDTETKLEVEVDAPGREVLLNGSSANLGTAISIFSCFSFYCRTYPSNDGSEATP